MHWYDHRDKGKFKNWFWKKKWFSSWWIIQFSEKNYGKCEKTWRCQACKNQSKNELLVSEPNYHTTKIFSKYFLAIEKNTMDTHD